MDFERTPIGQAVLLAVGTLVGGLVGWRASPTGRLVLLAGLPWLGYAGVQNFC